MMRASIVFALLFVAAAVGTSPAHYAKTADLEYLHKQKKIFELFFYLGQDPLTDTEYFEIGRNYDIYSNIDFYTKKDVVVDFLTWYKSGTMHKDTLFTYYSTEHREEMMMLFHLFYYAKDFTTFYKTACWARLYMNEGMFLIAFTTAVYHRPDTQYIHLPAIYEIYPSSFFSSKAIHKAYHMKMSHGYGYHGYHGYDMNVKHIDTMDSMETYYVYSNYTEVYPEPYYKYENYLNYFMEDADLNSYYYYFRMAYPFWISSKEYGFPSFLRGEFYYFFHKQLMARYYLERFSHGFGEIEDFTWEKMSLPGFYSDIAYFDGTSVPKREWWNFIPTYKYKYVEYLTKLETRILESIDSGFFFDEMGKQVSIYTPEGLNYLANLIEGNYDSYNIKYFSSYDALARDILGMSYDCEGKGCFIPSALHYFSTSMRDPAFYRIYDRILYFFQKYKSMLHRYTKSELDISGITIEGVEVDKVFTYFYPKEYFINSAVGVDSFKEGMSFGIKAKQYALTYKPFTYKFHINSDKDTKAVLRIFLGPASDEYKFEDYSYLLHYYQYFFMLDEFEVHLKSGINTFDHHSSESFFTKSDYVSADVYYKKVLKAIEGNEPFSYTDKFWGFPEHLLFPKGTVDGMKYKMYFYIFPYEEAKIIEEPIFGSFKYYGKPLGFPLDRPMYPWFLKLSNSYFKDIFIYHLKDYETKYGHGY